MAWRYENPGTADRLTVAGTTVLGNRVSRTGVAFYQTNRKACFGVQKTSEIWIRFDVYLFDGSGIRCYNGGSAGDTGIRLNGYLTSKENSRNYWVNGKGVHENGVLNGLHTVKIHLKSGTTNGAMEVYIDDGTKVAYSFVGNVNNGAQFDSIYIQSDDNKALASNVIISDADIAMDELLNGGVQPRIYRNIGTAEGLTISGTTVATSTKSKTGTAFWQSARSDCFGLPVMDEVWMKFDLYHEAGTSRFRAYANPSTITGICLKENTSNTVVSFLQNTNYNADNAYTLPSGRLQTFLLHIASDAVTGMRPFPCWRGCIFRAMTGATCSRMSSSRIRRFLSMRTRTGHATCCLAGTRKGRYAAPFSLRAIPAGILSSSCSSIPAGLWPSRFSWKRIRREGPLGLPVFTAGRTGR